MTDGKVHPEAGEKDLMYDYMQQVVLEAAAKALICQG